MTKEEFAKAINAILPDALKIKLNAIPLPTATAATPPTVAPYMANVPSGQPMYVDISDDGIPGVDMGDMVYTDAALTAPYPDGTYTLDDGSSVTVAGGTVTAYTPAAAPPPAMPAAMKAEFAAQKTAFAAVMLKFTAIEKQNKELKDQVEDITKINAIFTEAFKLLTETPVKDEPVKSVEKFAKEMTLVEYRELEKRDQVIYTKTWGGAPSK